MPHYAPFRPVQEVKISQTNFSPPPASVANLYHLHIRYFEGGDWQRYPCTHLPEVLVPLFEAGRVNGIHLDFLPLNSAQSWALAGGPSYVVLGASLTDGTQIECVPEALKKLFRRKILWALGAVVAGAAFALTPYSWLGGAAFVHGVYQVVSALRLPRKVHWPLRVAI